MSLTDNSLLQRSGGLYFAYFRGIIKTKKQINWNQLIIERCKWIKLVSKNCIWGLEE